MDWSPMSNEKNLHADVLIIGGGLVGLAASHSLARAGAKVICVDSGHFGEHQSSQNWGFVRQQGRGLGELDLMIEANKRWQELSDLLEQEVSWEKGGNLAVFDTPDEEESYRQWMREGRSRGIDTNYLDLDGIKQHIPNWKRSVRGGIFAGEDGHADPQTVVAAYIAACREVGVQLLADTPVRTLLRRGSTIIGAQTEAGILQAGTTVVAAGAWSRQLLSTAGIDLPQNYVVGSVALTTPVAPLTNATVWGGGFSFRQRRDGRFVCSVGGGGVVRLNTDSILQAPLFLSAFRKNWRRFALRPGIRPAKDLNAVIRGGQTIREIGPPAARVRTSEPIRALKQLQQTLTGTENARLQDSWAGVIDSTPDTLPVIDAQGGPDGLVIATGFSGHGYGLVPALGPIICDLVLRSQSSFDLSNFRLDRFNAGAFKAPNAVL